MEHKDSLFATPDGEHGDFVFDERVAGVFEDMISRSVPGYAFVVNTTAMLARRYARPGSNLYDLGCSLGAVALTMQNALSGSDVVIHAVDGSSAMISRLRELLAGRDDPDRPRILPLHQDILDTTIENASVVVLNFTLQFIEPRRREGLLAGIAAGLQPGGVLLLSEKIRFGNATEQRVQTEWHHAFKRAQGYSALEIARKRDALENVLRPDTLEQHLQRLRGAGFSEVHRWFQAFNFVSLLAMR